MRNLAGRAALLCVVLVYVPFAAWGSKYAAPMEAQRIAIVTGAAASGPELKAAETLKRRLMMRSKVEVVLVPGTDSLQEADITLVLGTPASSGLARELLEAYREHHRVSWRDELALPTLPNSETLHPEGFALWADQYAGKDYAVLYGSDARGVFYAVGKFLHDITPLTDRIHVWKGECTGKPAFAVRGGTPTGPGSRAIEFGELRAQTAEDALTRMEDLMLAGANVVGGDVEVVHSYGMMSYFGRKSNELPGGFQKEWGADNGRSTQYICPSVPEARKATLEAFDKWFSEQPFHEFFAVKSGDPGGCRCDKCEPWGATYIALTHEVADLLHKYHPDTKIIATNQDLSNEGNLAIFEYLNTHDSTWLHALRYGPGADEMQTYIRGPVNPRWFQYEGFGSLGNYLKYMHHELPRTTTLLGFTDVTHWMQAQYAVEEVDDYGEGRLPDVAMAALYDRRAWNARPQALHRVAREIFHYLDGDIVYSEGQHDDFNKWFWMRMLWDPAQDAEALTREYCRYYFGHEAAEEMKEAIFVMEANLNTPVWMLKDAVKPLRSAGKKIPENLLKIDHRWRVMMQKALMDEYLHLQSERADALKEKAARALEKIDKNSPKAMAKAVALLSQPLETAAMKALREEAKARGEEANAVAGYREPAPFIVDKYDLTETGWWRQTLEQALTTGDAAKMKNAAAMVLHYDDPGEGGFYDDAGWPGDSPHLTHGQTLWGFRPFFGPAKQSHYSVAYAFDPREGGVQFAYEGLDPQADYVVRIAAGGGGGRRGAGENPTQRLLADGTALGEAVPIPSEAVEYFEFEVPREATTDGGVTIALAPGTAEMRVTAVSEIWLMKKKEMFWTVRE